MKINKLVTLRQAKEIMYEHGIGASSEAILGNYLKDSEVSNDYPYDYDDLMRCIGVVRAFNIDIEVMKDTNYIWDRIIRNWEELVNFAIKGDVRYVDQLLHQIRTESKTSAEIVHDSSIILSITRSEPCETAKKLKITKLKRNSNA